MKGIILISGGLDSSTLLHYVGNKGVELYPVAFKYGQRHTIELSMCNKQVKSCQQKGYQIHDLKVIDITFMGDLLKGSSALIGKDIEVPSMEEIGEEEQPITYVPFRNALFLTVALSYAEAVGASKVFYGAQQQDYAGYWDTRVNFVEKMNEVSSLNRKHQIEIVAPFVKLRKSEIVKLGLDLGVDYKDTWSSYEVVDEEKLIADSLNPTSVDRIRAFAEVGVKDPQKYQEELPWEDLFKKANKVTELKEIENKIGDMLW